MKTKYLRFLYQKHVTEKNYNRRIERDFEGHNWLIRKYENLKKIEKNPQSEYGLALYEKQLNRRIKRDLKDNNWQTQSYKKHDKLEMKPQDSKDIAKENARMSRQMDMAEGRKMLEFLSANGIKTLEQLKDIFRHCQNKTVDEEVVFVKEIKRDAASSISQEKLNMVIEASTRNKEILLKDLSNKSAGTSNPRPVAQQSGNIDVPGRSVVNAGCTKNNLNSLPMRYRHKHTHQNPFQQEIRCQQQRERYRQACKGNAHQENIQYHRQQQNYHVHIQNRYEGVGQNITGYNNGSGHTMATWPCGGGGGVGGGGINSLGQTIPVTQDLVSTTVYNAVPQQQWPSATSMAHTGYSGYINYDQLHLTPQTYQQPGTQYMVGNRPIYKPN